MKIIAILLLSFPTITFAQNVASPMLVIKMLEGAEANITEFCGAENIIEFTRSPEVHETFVSVTVEGRRKMVFAPKLTGLAACKAPNGVSLIQWTAHSNLDLKGELNFSGVSKTFFVSSKLAPALN